MPKARTPQSRNPLVRFQRGFEDAFELVRGGYRRSAVDAMRTAGVRDRSSASSGFQSAGAVVFLGRNFFPNVDADDPDACAHQVAPASRKSAIKFADVQKAIRKVIPPD